MRMLIKELTPSRGGEGTCSLVPLEKMALFPKNKILIFYVPCSPKLPVFSLFICLCSPVPQKPWEGLRIVWVGPVPTRAAHLQPLIAFLFRCHYIIACWDHGRESVFAQTLNSYFIGIGKPKYKQLGKTGAFLNRIPFNSIELLEMMTSTSACLCLHFRGHWIRFLLCCYYKIKTNSRQSYDHIIG